MTDVTVIEGRTGEDMDIDNEIRYDPDRGVYRAQYEWGSDDSLSAFVVDSVAAVTNASPTELEPLYGVVDPDALDKLYAPTYDRSLRRGDGCTTFAFGECTVTVYSDGTVEVEPPSEP